MQIKIIKLLMSDVGSIQFDALKKVASVESIILGALEAEFVKRDIRANETEDQKADRLISEGKDEEAAAVLLAQRKAKVAQKSSGKAEGKKEG